MNLFMAQLAVSFLSLASVWKAGDRHISAWYLLIGGHLLFLIYSAVTEQWGFWVLNVGMVVIGVRNLRRDLNRRRDERTSTVKSEV